MFKKMYIVSSAMLFSLVLAVSNANAISVGPAYAELFSYTVNDVINSGEQGTALDGLVQHEYSFTADGGDRDLTFFLDFNFDNGQGFFGIIDFIAVWTDAANVMTSHIISDSNSIEQGGSPFFHSLLEGETGVLTLTGNWRELGGQYSLSVSAVPLPPAVIAFGTAMLGVGFLARRRRKQKATFA